MKGGVNKTVFINRAMILLLQMKRLGSSFNFIISHKFFFGFIVAIVVIQASWYAFSFQPSMYDEAMHFELTQMYSEQASPFITHQDSKWDSLGQITRDPDYLFYYLMSWPLKLVSQFTDSVMIQLNVLRFICTTIFIVGLFFFRKAFLSMGLSKMLVNLSLLFFVITPGVAVLPGVLNYDNVVILLTGILFYLAVKNIQENKVSFTRISLIILIGLVGAPIKVEFLAIYAPVFLYLVFNTFNKYHASFFRKFSASFMKTRIWLRLALITSMIIGGALFIERPIVNLFEYHSLSPKCTQILSKERCSVNNIANRNMVNSENRKARGDEFKPIDVYNYFLTLWFPTIIRHHASPAATLSVMKFIYLNFFTVGIALALLYMRDLFKKNEFKVIGITILVYVAAVLYSNYSAFVDQAVPVAMNGRYIFPVLPFIIVFVAIAVKKILRSIRLATTIPVIVFFLIMTQGGGVITYIMDDYQPVFWQNSFMKDANANLKNVLENFVKN